jgi:hypothetical protein
MLRKFFVFILLVLVLSWQACEYEVLPADVNCEENPVAIALVSADDSQCALKDGRVEVVATGGAGSYSYRLGEGEPQESPVFENLGAGLYEITATDENGCSATMEVTVLNSNGMNISFTTTDSGCNGSEGTLTVDAFDGTEPYLFKLEGGSFSENATFTDLAQGEYDLTVSDAIGCEVVQTVKIRSGISFDTSISAIIENSCAINDCHNGSQFPDFRVFKNIHDNAAQIKALTGDRSMPQEGTLTQAEINMIACWVDDGALDN